MTSSPAQLGTGISEYRGAQAVSHFAPPEQEFAALRGSCVVMDRGWRVRLRVSGGDSQRWLNGMVTNTADLAPGHGNYSFLLNPQGRLQGDMYVFRDGDGYILETDACQRERITAWLNRYIIMDDVMLEEVTGQTATLALAGPDATNILAMLGASAPETPLLMETVKIDGVVVTMVRDDASCLPLYSLWHDPAHTRQLLDTLKAAGALPAGWQTAELLRIASGTPLFGVDLRERDLPQETGQDRALHFSKGCYIGQEIVERIRSRGAVHRGWSGFVLDTAPGATLPSPGTSILQGDATVGDLTSIVTLPLAEGAKSVGLGIVRLQAIATQSPLLADGVTLQPARLPFL